ncbi:DUF6597 domain-containing transcriptional factor [Actinoplanes sp. NPDC049681]|uniref:DUF6597 domain-containing transcriptional factor n=1 Tax=Actinoplanes sp. NPDC049681 TaxID=3363905 RepID=UPI0037B9A0C7
MSRDARELGGAWASFQTITHAAAPPGLSSVIDHCWTADWDLRGQAPYRQKIIPTPTVHLAFRDGVPFVTGPARRHVVRNLEGRGSVFGIAFRPGCFRPFLGRAVATLVGRSLPAAEIFGVAPGCATVEQFLRDRLRPDPTADAVAAMVDRIRLDRRLTRVDALAAAEGIGVRRLQRLFQEYVGLGPKWVIRRYRLQEVTERLGGGIALPDWAALAAKLGYADQAHFVRDFTAMVGESPSVYARRYPSG